MSPCPIASFPVKSGRGCILRDSTFRDSFVLSYPRKASFRLMSTSLGISFLKISSTVFHSTPIVLANAPIRTELRIMGRAASSFIIPPKGKPVPEA